MYLYNTTFAVALPIIEEWLEYMKQQHLPEIKQQYNQSRFCRVDVEPQDDYASYALQFEIATLQEIEDWKKNKENNLLQAIKKIFGDKVLFFSTKMEIIE